MTKPSVCSVVNCKKKIHRRKMCNGHYRRWRLYKNTFTDIPLRTSSAPLLKEAERLKLFAVGKKRCPGCKGIKGVSSFGNNNRSRDGLRCWCHDCRRAQRRKDKYGLTRDNCKSILVRQGHRCPICETLITLETGVVDHDHKTGEIRGFLCGPCNNMLGLFEKRGCSIRRVIAYITGDLFRQSLTSSSQRGA